MADAVVEHLGSNPPVGIAVETMVEPRPAGTAGALRYARRLLRSDPAMVMNGDSFVDADLSRFLRAHLTAGRSASILSVRVPDVSRYGRLEGGSDGLVARFVEKDPTVSAAGDINAGVYLFDRVVIDEIADGSAESLERDVLPQLAARGLHCHATDGAFIDIGTPESFAAAPGVLAPYRMTRGLQ